MFDYLGGLSATEADNLRKTIVALFRQTCILKTKYDPDTLEPRDNPQFDICDRHRDFIGDYLAVLGCELAYDSQERIFWITGEGANPEKLNATETKYMLILKMIYRDKILGKGLSATVTNLEEIRSYGAKTGLIKEKPLAGDVKDALFVMSRHQIIEVSGAIQNVDDRTHIYIYGTINMYLTSMDVMTLVNEYQGEDASDETGEESNYQIADE